MGTRVDFYVGRGETAEWLGSYPFDGYPSGVFEDRELPLFAERPIAEETWRTFIAEFLAKNADRATLPEMGWPWPWKDSRTTDYAYAWDGGEVFGSCFGHAWFQVDPADPSWGEPDDDDEAKSAVFPDMTARAAVTYGARSGLIVIGVPADPDAS